MPVRTTIEHAHQSVSTTERTKSERAERRSTTTAATPTQEGTPLDTIDTTHQSPRLERPDLSTCVHCHSYPTRNGTLTGKGTAEGGDHPVMWT